MRGIFGFIFLYLKLPAPRHSTVLHIFQWDSFIFFVMFFFRFQNKNASPCRSHPFLTTFSIINFQYRIMLLCYMPLFKQQLFYFFSVLFLCCCCCCYYHFFSLHFHSFPYFNITRIERKSCVEWLFLAGSLCVKRFSNNKNIYKCKRTF